MESTRVVSPIFFPRNSVTSLIGKFVTSRSLVVFEGKVITRDEIDVASEQSLFCGFRAVAKFEADFEPVLLPNPRFLHHLPDREMGMRAIEAAYFHHRLLSHKFLLNSDRWSRFVPFFLSSEGESDLAAKTAESF